MDIDISHLDEKKRFDVKLQISLYNTALKVMRPDKRGEFEAYMEERVKKIRELLEVKDRNFRIFEDGNLIFEVQG